MSDLDIVLKLDPSAPVAGAKAVTAEVAKAEEQGKRTRAAFDSLSKGFASMAQGIRTQTARALHQTARAFDGLTEAIRREQVMLEKIHGPAKRYAEDLQTLDSLLARNVINTQQYAEQVANLNRQIERSSSVTKAAEVKAPAVSAGLAPAGLASIASDVGSIKLKQAASAVNQAFSLLNNQLKITDSTIGSAIGSAVKFGATGAQIAGPWGAAIGAVVGVTTELIGKLDGGRAEFRKMIEEEQKLAKAYWEAKKAAEQKKRIEEELAPATERNAQAARELAEATQIVNRVMNESVDAFRVAATEAQAYETRLWNVNEEIRERLRLEGKIRPAPSYDSKNTPQGGETEDEAEAIKADRGARDAALKKEAALRSYGKTLQSLVATENARIDRIKDLEQIQSRMDLPERVRKQALKEYNELVKKTAKALAELGENQRRVFNGMAVMTSAGGNIGTSERQQVTSQTGGDGMWGQLGEERRRQETQRAVEEQQRKIRDHHKQIAEEQKKLILNTKKWREELESVNSISGVVLNQVVSSASELSSTLVDAAMGADVSWSDFGRNLLVTFQKVIAQALILRALTGSVSGQKGAGVGGGYGGLFGLLGFASGGMIYPSGSGTSDSQTVMFRKSPSETVRIHTPSQEAAYRRGGPEGGGGGATVRVVSEVNRRALYSESDLVVDISRNRDTIRRLIA